MWSEINVANVARLTKAGKMQPAGFAQVEAAKADGRWAKVYRMTKSEAPKDLLAAIEASPKARAMYATLSAQNRFSLTFRTRSLKTEEGRKKKIPKQGDAVRWACEATHAIGPKTKEAAFAASLGGGDKGDRILPKDQ